MIEKVKGMRTLRKDTVFSENLDFIRGMAAIFVLLVHVRSILFVPYGGIQAPNIFDKVVYFVSGLGLEAVMVFFVLSGLLVGSSVQNSIRKDSYHWPVYLINRLSRLYVVLIPALLLSAVIAYVGCSYFLGLKPNPSVSMSNFFKNLLFLQSIIASCYATNLPLWSLANEFWYYLIFPCLVFSLLSKEIFKKFIYAFAAGLMLIFIGHEKSMFFLVWLLGILIFLLKPIPSLRLNSAVRRAFLILPVMGMLCEFILSRLHIFSELERGFMTGIFFALLLYVISHNDSLSQKSGWYYFLAARTSSCSYTLYLIHYPILLFIGDVAKVSWQPDFKHLILAALISFAIFILAYFLSLVTEAKTGNVRNMLLKIFNQSLKLKSKVEAFPRLMDPE